MGLREFENHLFDETIDGYIQVVQINKGKKIKVYSTTNVNLRTIIEEEIETNENVYVTPNTLFIPKRGTRNIRQFRALYQDIDCEKKGIDKDQAIYEIWQMYQDGDIPEPTMIVDSGRGLHIYWKIQHAPYAAIRTWQELQDYFYYKLVHLGADSQAIDATRVLRAPETLNTKNGAICEVVNINKDLIYSMYDLREEYLDYTPRETQVKWFIEKEHTKEKISEKKETKVIKNKFFNSYSLHIARAEDIETLCELRGYDMYGCRNMVIHCYAYWKGITIRNSNELAELVYSLNDKFKEPLRDSEVEAVLNSIPKAIEKFIAYEQGLRNKEIKRVSKGMRDKGGYWYKNTTLIERLSITREEQSKLQTIIGLEEKYDRNNERRKKERRNEEGLTKAQQELKELKYKVLEIQANYTKKLSLRKLEELTGFKKDKISRAIKSEY